MKKIWMKYLKILEFKSPLTLSLLIFIISAPICIRAQSSTPHFDHLKTQFENNRVYSAAFTHEYNDTFTGEQQITKGLIWVGKDGYKMQSGNNLMVVDGEISRVYDHTKNRVIISDYIEEDDDFAPSRMLQGVDEGFSVTETILENGQTRILLNSDDPFSIFITVSIYLDENKLPLRIEALDQVENELITRFEDGKFITEDSNTFEFDHPDDAEWIDLRHDI